MVKELTCLNNKEINEFIRILNKVIRIGIKFNTRKVIVKKYTASYLIEKIHEDIPKYGKDIRKLLDYFEKNIMPYCVVQSNSKYLAFPDSGNSFSGLVADILKIFMNQNLIADAKSGPIATYLEIQIVQWLRDLIGFKINNKFPKNINDVGGVFCPGGVLSNITALLVARSRLLKNSFNKGIMSNKVYLLAPEIISHYSLESAMGYLGFGVNKVIKVKLNKHFGIEISDLKKKIKIASKKGSILAVVIYAGDSRTMKVDNIKAVYNVCKKYKLWLHVDACHGSQLLFSKENRKKINGLELVDSVTIDPHKVLMVTYPCSAVLFKEPKELMYLSRNFDMTIQPTTYDLGQITPFIGSKSFDSLKLWFLFKSIGKNNLGKIIDKRIKMTKYTFGILSNYSQIKLFNEVNINSLCFIFFPLDLQKLYKLSDYKKQMLIMDFIDLLNKKIHDNIYCNGKFCIHTFKLTDVGNRALLKNTGSRQVLGIIIGNPLTKKRDIKLLIKEIIRTGEKIYKTHKLISSNEK